MLLTGVASRRAAAAAVTMTGLNYLIATVLELFHGADLLGIVPVDIRDRFVHPLLALAAAACVLIARRATCKRSVAADKRASR